MIKVGKGDITTLAVDAIVNAAIHLRRGFREIVRLPLQPEVSSDKLCATRKTP